MSLNLSRPSLRTAAPLALGMLMAACSMAPEAPAPATPATLASVKSLAPNKCNAQTAAALDELGVPPDQIRSITYDRRSAGTRSFPLGYDVYVRTSDQAGEMVLRQNRSCEVFASHNAPSRKMLTAGR
jgi:hypothetical protein